MVIVNILIYIDYQLHILPKYHISHSDQLVDVCGMPPYFPTDWFVPDGRVGGTPDDRVGVCVPALRGHEHT